MSPRPKTALSALSRPSIFLELSRLKMLARRCRGLTILVRSPIHFFFPNSGGSSFDRYSQRGGSFLLTHANTGVSKAIIKIVKGKRKLSDKDRIKKNATANAAKKETSAKERMGR